MESMSFQYFGSSATNPPAKLRQIGWTAVLLRSWRQGRRGPGTPKECHTLLAMQLYAITDRKRLATPAALLDQVSAWAAGGVDYIQLRENDLDRSRLQALAAQMMGRLQGSRTRLLINTSMPILALAAGAQGVHVAGSPTPDTAARVRDTFPGALVSVPCHTLEEVATARAAGVDLILFSPVFGKEGVAAQGLPALGVACTAAGHIPVFALGGVTPAHAPQCVAAGAAGVAGIRLFAGTAWHSLRRLEA